MSVSRLRRREHRGLSCGYDLYDIGRSVFQGESVSGTQVLALGGDIAGAAIPFATGVGAAIRAGNKIDNAIDAGKGASNFAAKSGGRAGRQARLRQLADDPKVSSAHRGWIKQEMKQIERGTRKNIRMPGSGRRTGSGQELTHPRGREAAKGFSHTEAPSHLQDVELHRLQHKYDDYGRRNPRRE